MVNSKSQLTTSAAVLLLMFSYSSYAKDWKPTSSEEVILTYEPSSKLIQNRSSTSSTTLIEQQLNQIESLVAASKYPGQSNKLVLAKKHIDELSNLQGKLSAEQLDRYRLIKANIAQAQHDFDEAILLLSDISPSRNLYPQSLLVQSRIYLLKGQSAQAEQLCKKLITHHVQAAELCLLDAKLSKPENPSIEKTMELFEQRYAQSHSPLSQYFYQIAGTFHRIKKNTSKAQYYFEFDLEQAPVSQWYQWADMAIANGQSQKVYNKILSLKNKLTDSSKLEDGLLVRLARAEKLATKEQTAQTVAQQRIELRELRNDTLHAADMAYFYLHVSPAPESALKWAQLNWQNVKEVSDKELLEKSQKANQ